MKDAARQAAAETGLGKNELYATGNENEITKSDIIKLYYLY